MDFIKDLQSTLLNFKASVSASNNEAHIIVNTLLDKNRVT